jgi:FtsH-binding integral membrane protein
MADYEPKGFSTQSSTQARTQGYAGAQTHEIDDGLRAYMLRVYNYMASALFITGGVAYLAAQSQDVMNLVHGTPLKWVVMLAPLGMVFFLSARINKMSTGAAQATFWIFSMLMGLSLSYIFIVYTGASIARTFFITAGMFGAMSLWGYTTKRDLTGMGSFLMMGLIGMIIAMVVNMFMQSTMMQLIISAVGVLIFTGLTAYDTQKIKNMYSAVDDSDIAGKKAIMGALTLYLDFLNLFLMLLHFFGNRE